MYTKETFIIDRNGRECWSDWIKLHSRAEATRGVWNWRIRCFLLYKNNGFSFVFTTNRGASYSNWIKTYFRAKMTRNLWNMRNMEKAYDDYSNIWEHQLFRTQGEERSIPVSKESRHFARLKQHETLRRANKKISIYWSDHVLVLNRKSGTCYSKRNISVRGRDNAIPFSWRNGQYMWWNVLAKEKESRQRIDFSRLQSFQERCF